MPASTPLPAIFLRDELYEQEQRFGARAYHLANNNPEHAGKQNIDGNREHADRPKCCVLVEARKAATHAAIAGLLQCVLKETTELHEQEPNTINEEHALILAMYRTLHDEAGRSGGSACMERGRIFREHGVRPYSARLIVQQAGIFLLRYLAEITGRDIGALTTKEHTITKTKTKQRECRTQNHQWDHTGRDDDRRKGNPLKYR